MVLNAAPSGRSVWERAGWIDVGLLLLSALFMMWRIGSYGLYEPHEAQYGGGGSAMVQRGDWVTPHINGEREVNKPPLFYWLIATSFLLLSHIGFSPEFVARLPLALIALSGIVLAWQWARELWGIRAGRCAALMLAVSTGWYIFAHQLLIDELLSVLILASLYLMWKGLRAPASKWPLVLFYVCIGLAVLAKALVGLFFPLAIAGLFVLIRRDWSLLRRSRPLLGICVIACVVGPWAYLFETHNPGALRYLIINEHFKRAVDAREPHDYGGVQVGAAMFVVYALVWCTPWSFLLPQTASFSLANAPKNKSAAEPQPLRDAVLLLTLGAALPALFFLLFPSRLIYYSIPSVPSFAILCAGFWNSPELWNGWKRRLAAGTIGLMGLATLGSAAFLPRMLADIPDLENTPALLRAIPIEALIAGAVLVLCGLLIHWRKERTALIGLVLLMAALEVFNVREFANFDWIASSKRMVEALAPAVGSDCIWISEGSDEVGSSAGTAFYLRQNTPNKTAFVLIMGQDPKRPPPIYPGPPLKFFIDQNRLDELWGSKAPVLYVTDFKRTDWERDKPTLPSKDRRLVPLKVAGHRQVYANAEAWRRLVAAGAIGG
jgi:4-amino-4-deoxy-L-arabinose transferase-like glycosyltransferase